MTDKERTIHLCGARIPRLMVRGPMRRVSSLVVGIQVVTNRPLGLFNALHRIHMFFAYGTVLMYPAINPHRDIIHQPFLKYTQIFVTVKRLSRCLHRIIRIGRGVGYGKDLFVGELVLTDAVFEVVVGEWGVW